MLTANFKIRLELKMAADICHIHAEMRLTICTCALSPTHAFAVQHIFAASHCPPM